MTVTSEPLESGKSKKCDKISRFYIKIFLGDTFCRRDCVSLQIKNYEQTSRRNAQDVADSQQN